MLINHRKPSTFAGTGNSLSGRVTSTPSSAKGKSKENANPAVSTSSWGSGGQTLSSGRSNGSRSSRPTNIQDREVGAGGAPVPVLPNRSKRKETRRSPTPDFGVDDDEDVTYIDSD